METAPQGKAFFCHGLAEGFAVGVLGTRERTPAWRRLSPVPNTWKRLSPARPRRRRSFNCQLCFWMASTPVRRTNRTPARSPAMPGMLWVPASRRSGRKSGMACSLELLPVRRRAGLPGPGAEEGACALGAVEPLVARHGDKVRSQAPHVDREGAGGLGGVDDKGDSPLPADLADLLDGQDIAEDIGDMGADYRVRPLCDQRPEPLDHGRLVKERGIDHMDLQPWNGVEGTGDGVVFISGNHDPPAWGYQGVDSEIQSMGGVGGEYYLFRVLHAEERAQFLPTGIQGLGSQGRALVVAPARGTHGFHGLEHRLSDGRRLLEGGGGRIEVDHRAATFTGVIWLARRMPMARSNSSERMRTE